ncbi:MAG TPA: thiol:disulfide interchange protein DsbA/DsbL [Nevskiaceae bacterium]|nr:thiol:disulfide interchange protein DsbA/DsbL [Nevskiaceae bacterium]
MSVRRLLTAVLAAALVACSKPAPPPPAATAPPPAAPPSAVESSDAAPLMSASLVQGRDYEVVADGIPFDTPTTEQVEVAEFFNYACPACNSFEPKLEQWRRSLPSYVHVVYLPLDFRPDFVPYARAYFAAEALGVAATSHEAVYAAIHQTHKLPGEGTPVDADTLAKFYAQFGVDPEKFKQAMASDMVAAKIAAARVYAAHSGVHSTPTLLIEGKYLVKGQSFEDYLQNATQLIAKARAS